MKKQILMTVILLLIAPFSTFAISLKDIQDNPNKYIGLGENTVGAIYIDIDSIRSIRYSPPYYSIQSIEYFVDYKANIILQSRKVFNYNRSIKSLIEEQQRIHPSISKDAVVNVVLKEIKKDSGIISSIFDRKVYSFNGTYLGEVNNVLGENVITFSNGFREADYIFYKYYNIHF